MAITHLSHLIVNTAAGCHSHRQALGLSDVIPTLPASVPCFGKEKSNVLSFESERFTTSVT